MKLVPYSRICYFVLILLILSSCGVPSGEETPQAISSSTVQMNLTQTQIPASNEPIPTLTTAPPTAESTQIPPVTPTKDLSKFNIPGTIATGTLWIYYEDQDEYYVYDFSAKSFSIVKAPPPDCDKTPLINSLDVICRSDGHASIYNLLSEERRVLSITDADFVWQQNSIPELLFYLKRDINLNEGYFSYNLSSGESKYLITLHLEGFETLPKFSSSGDYAVAVKNDEVIKIDLGTGEYTALFSGDEHATFNLWWSPTLPMVAFGVMDYIPLDVGHRANLIYSLEPETGAIKQLFPTEELKAYFSETDEWPIWSPSGDNFIAIAYERLFVINVSGEILMIQTKSNISAEGYPIGDIAWSPDGEYIAFFEYPNGYLENTNLIIYSMKENRPFEVIENEGMSSIFWR